MTKRIIAAPIWGEWAIVGHMLLEGSVTQMRLMVVGGLHPFYGVWIDPYLNSSGHGSMLRIQDEITSVFDLEKYPIFDLSP
jgi:hypothetical protein